ncbi:polycystin 2 [Marininema halotolerans]|uniref:Polycystin 2 n=1 Tax=Marininema halotolerans TaxID=1155944 RepID=A0A1I6RPY2_9BACL|nr:polycystin 2 [Marininema halotolerans]
MVYYSPGFGQPTSHWSFPSQPGMGVVSPEGDGSYLPTTSSKTPDQRSLKGGWPPPMVSGGKVSYTNAYPDSYPYSYAPGWLPPDWNPWAGRKPTQEPKHPRQTFAPGFPRQSPKYSQPVQMPQFPTHWPVGAPSYFGPAPIPNPGLPYHPHPLPFSPQQMYPLQRPLFAPDPLPGPGPAPAPGPGPAPGLPSQPRPTPTPRPGSSRTVQIPIKKAEPIWESPESPESPWFFVPEEEESSATKP